MRETLTKAGKLGLRLLEDLTALAAGGSVCADLNLCFLGILSTSVFVEFVVFGDFRNYCCFLVSHLHINIFSILTKKINYHAVISHDDTV